MIKKLAGKGRSTLPKKGVRQQRCKKKRENSQGERAEITSSAGCLGRLMSIGRDDGNI